MPSSFFWASAIGRTISTRLGALRYDGSFIFRDFPFFTVDDYRHLPVIHRSFDIVGFARALWPALPIAGLVWLEPGMLRRPFIPNLVRRASFILHGTIGRTIRRVFIDIKRVFVVIIGHVHCKDIQKKPAGSGQEWAAMGRGTIDWTGQFRALKQQGYKYATSLETHWRGASTPEESTRQSWAGMKKELQEAGALS